MQLHGYELGQEPSPEEYEVYRRVERHLQRESVADWLHRNAGERRPTPVERLMHALEKKAASMVYDTSIWELN